MDSRDSGSENASGVSLGVIDKEHFDSAKEVVVRRAEGAGKAVESTSHPGDSIAAAHEGGAVLNSEKFEVARGHERRKVLIVEANMERPRGRDAEEGFEEREPAMSGFSLKSQVWVEGGVRQMVGDELREVTRDGRPSIISNDAEDVINITHKAVEAVCVACVVEVEVVMHRGVQVVFSKSAICDGKGCGSR